MGDREWETKLEAARAAMQEELDRCAHTTYGRGYDDGYEAGKRDGWEQAKAEEHPPEAANDMSEPVWTPNWED